MEATTTAQGALIVLAAVLLTLAGLAWTADRADRGVEKDRWERERQRIERMSNEQRRSYLKHPSGKPRCACRRWWVGDGTWTVDDDDGAHSAKSCPERAEQR